MIYWHSHSLWTFHNGLQLEWPSRFATWVTIMVKLSLSKHSLFVSQNMAQKWVGMTVFKLNVCPREWQPAAVFTIKRLRQATAACGYALHISWVFSVELKLVASIKKIKLYPDFFSLQTFSFSTEYSQPGKCAFLQIIPMAASNKPEAAGCWTQTLFFCYSLFKLNDLTYDECNSRTITMSLNLYSVCPL